MLKTSRIRCLRQNERRSIVVRNEPLGTPSTHVGTSARGLTSPPPSLVTIVQKSALKNSQMLQNFKKNEVEHSVQEPARPQVVEIAASLPDGKPISLICNKVVTVYTELQIRHASALTLRGTRWLVTDQTVGDPLRGRPTLEVLGLNTRNILAAAAEKHSGTVDIADLESDDSKFPRGTLPKSREFWEASFLLMKAPTMQISTKMMDASTSDPKMNPRRTRCSTIKSQKPAGMECPTKDKLLCVCF